MNTVKFKITAFGQLKLRRALDRLPFQVRNKIMVDSITKSAEPIENQMKINASKHDDSGAMSESVGFKTARYGYSNENAIAVAVIGPRFGFKRQWRGHPRDPMHYAHLVEFGVQPHIISPDGKGFLKIGEDFRTTHVKHPGNPAFGFMRKAFDTRKRTAIKIFGREAWKGIKKFNAKVAKG